MSLNPKKSGALVKRNLQPVGREGPKKPECQVKSTIGTNSELRCSELWITVLPMRKPRLRFISKTKLSRVGEGDSCKVQAKWRHSLRRLKMRDTPDGARPCPLQSRIWGRICPHGPCGLGNVLDGVLLARPNAQSAANIRLARLYVESGRRGDFRPAGRQIRVGPNQRRPRPDKPSGAVSLGGRAPNPEEKAIY